MAKENNLKKIKLNYDEQKLVKKQDNNKEYSKNQVKKGTVTSERKKDKQISNNSNKKYNKKVSSKNINSNNKDNGIRNQNYKREKSNKIEKEDNQIINDLNKKYNKKNIDLKEKVEGNKKILSIDEEINKKDKIRAKKYVKFKTTGKNKLESPKLIKKSKNKSKKIIINIIITFLLIFCVLSLSFIIYTIKQIFLLDKKYLTKEVIEINYQDYFANEVVTLNKKILYKMVNDNLKISGVIGNNISLNLEKDDLFKNGYFKIKDTLYYINYEDIKSIKNEEISSDTFSHYIPYNESVVVNNPKFYLNDEFVFSINGEFKFPILIKENNYYGIVLDNKLYYLKKEDVNVVSEHNTDLKSTNGISVLTYHFTYDSTKEEERKDCNQIICLSDIQFKKHMQFIKDEGFYTATLRDLELFIEGKIRLPEKTVVITIDDGNYIIKSVEILEELDLHATVFLIGSVGETTGYDYKSPNIEVHSHTYNLHYVGACSGGQGSPLKCLNRNKILEDLKKSRESLNNTTYFCYPFFEYNDYAISILKEVGFTMAFNGGRQKVRNGTNKYLVPRYGIINTTTVNELRNIIY